ncbi:MAG: DUF2231 domain-containing protein [Chthoniobacterales bacterium]
MKLPDPLHPAIVHFPIVLILFGTLFSVICIFVRRFSLPLFAAILLACGAAGAFTAVYTGENAADNTGDLSKSVDHLLNEHAHYGEVTRNVSTIAAVLAVASACFSRRNTFSRSLAILTAVAACYASWNVYKAGKHGGMLVYDHGVSVKSVLQGDDAAPSPSPSTTP